MADNIGQNERRHPFLVETILNYMHAAKTDDLRQRKVNREAYMANMPQLYDKMDCYCWAKDYVEHARKGDFSKKKLSIAARILENSHFSANQSFWDVEDKLHDIMRIARGRNDMGDINLTLACAIAKHGSDKYSEEVKEFLGCFDKDSHQTKRARIALAALEKRLAE